MDSKKTMTVLALVLLFGLGTEVLKKFNVIGSRPPAEVETVSVAGMDLSPYHRDNKNDLVPSSARLGKMAGFKLAQAKAGGHDFGKAKKAAAEKKKKAQKKKKKKKVIAGTGQTSEETKAKVYEEQKKAERERQEKAPIQTASAAIIPVTEEKDLGKEYQKWAALLLNGANREEVIRFIRAYQTGNVDINVFYQIIQAMYDEKSEEYRELAVLAAGLTPSLRSFDFLTAALAENRSGDELTAQIRTELKDYSILQYVWVAGAALQTTNDPLVAYEAAVAFDLSTKRYITASALTPVDPAATDDSMSMEDPETVRTPSSAQNISARFFLQYRAALTAAALRFQTEPEIHQLLQSSLERIKQVELVAMNQVQ